MVDALEPRHSLECRRDKDHHELGAALALGRRAPFIGYARTAQHGAVDLPTVVDARQIPLKLAPVDGGGHLHGADCGDVGPAYQYLATAPTTWLSIG